MRLSRLVGKRLERRIAMPDTSIQQDNFADLYEIGHKFYHKGINHLHTQHCKGCGRKRNGDGWSGDNNCPTCGNSYSYTERKVVPIYVIGYYRNFKGEQGYMLSETSPTDIGDKGYSYWSKPDTELGKEYFETEGETNHD
jgi:hypothetical protein